MTRRTSTTVTRAATALAAMTTAAAALTALAGPASAADQTALPGKTKVVITGHGWGHGHGMSQYGAQGAALHGRTAQQVIEFYYPHTKAGKAGGDIRVKLAADTSRNVIVVARSGLRARKVGSSSGWDLAKRHPHAERWRITPLDRSRDRLDYRVKGTWHSDLTVSSRLEFRAGGAPLQLVLPDGSTDSYRGTLRAAQPAGAAAERDTVNILSLENYLRGVVPRESPSSWKSVALRAQAVAARSYAAYQRDRLDRGHYDVVDTTADQAYGGYSAEVASTNAAVRETAGKIRSYGGRPAFTQFSSSMGGYTLAGGKPYLVSQADPYEKYSDSPYATWKHTLTVGQLNKRWPGAGGIVGISLVKEPDTGGRYVRTVKIDGVKQDYQISGWDFRNWAGLRSSWFTRTIQKP